MLNILFAAVLLLSFHYNHYARTRMAIYGNLDTFPLQDIALIIKARTGLLTITSPEGTYELYCNQDYLRGILFPHGSAGSILESLSYLVQQKTGQFHFDETSAPPAWLNPNLKLPLCETLASISFATPTAATTEEHLPHPDIRYVLLRSRKPSMHPDLAHFLERAENLLAGTCSAREIATQLNLTLKVVQHYLNELRKINKILPVRAYKQPQMATVSGTTIAEPAPSRPAEHSVVKRLLSLLRKGTA